MKPTIYLFFDGDCLEAMTRYAELLGGEVGGVFRNAEAPDAESRMPGGDDLVMNMAITVDGTTIMASDTPPEWHRPPQGFRISIELPTPVEFERVQAALSDGARSVEMEPGETFWAERFAMLTDRHGTPWMLSHTGAKGA